MSRLWAFDFAGMFSPLSCIDIRPDHFSSGGNLLKRDRDNVVCARPVRVRHVEFCDPEHV